MNGLRRCAYVADNGMDLTTVTGVDRWKLAYQSFCCHAASWKDISGKENWALSTYEGNVSLINNYILPIIGDAKLSEINTRFIERYYQSLLKRRAVINPLNKTSRNEFVSSSTVRDVNKLLRNCFEQAVKHCLRNKRKCLRSIVMKYLPAEQRQKSFFIA